MRKCLALTKKFARCGNDAERRSLFCSVHRWWWLLTSVTVLVTTTTILANLSTMFGTTFSLPFATVTSTHTATATSTWTPQPSLTPTSTPDKSGNSVSVGGDNSGIVVQGDNNVVSPPTVVVTVNSQPDTTYNKWCVIAESGALFFVTPVLLPSSQFAVLSLYPGTKIYVTDNVGVHYKISQAEFNLGDQVEDYGPVTINKVLAGAPADKAGIRAGDIVISIDGIPADNPIAIAEYTMNRLNQKIVLEIKRNNELLVFEVIPEIIQGAPRIGVYFSNKGKYTGIVKRDLPGYVPIYFVSCNPDVVNQNTTTKLPEGLFSFDEPTSSSP